MDPMYTTLACRRLLPLLMAALIAGCGGSSSPTAPSVAAIPFTTTDLVVGDGTEAVAGRRLVVDFIGWLHSPTAPENKGAVFDSSLGGPPFTFVLGAGQVIRGWDQGIPGMRVGGLRRLVIPPDLAFGSAGAGGVIPPNATLIFEVQLLDVAQ